MRLPVTVLLAASVLAVSAAPARADYVGWQELLPALGGSYQPSSSDDCAAGRTSCVDKLIRRMYRRLEPQLASCDHDAVFSLAYLRTTERYRRTIEDPEFFDDTPFVNHLDIAFAERYFDAFDAWNQGARSDVPEPWAQAFAATDRRELSGLGDMVLGMNAHINYDLPLVLAGLGMVRPDGTSRKSDHDRVNRFLTTIQEAIVIELAKRLDDSADDTNLPVTADELASFQTIALWRETAWRNAERLAAAPDDATRARVIEAIEAYAGFNAVAIRRAFGYLPVLQGPERRAAFCAANAGG